MTRVTPATRVRAAIVRASSPASAGVVCIFQLAATITSRIRWIMPEPGWPGTGGRRASSVASRSSRSSARWTAERWISSRSASSARLASGVSRRASATRRTTYGWSGSRPSASSVAIASSWRPAALTARWRFADSALRTRLSSPRRARDTWRASSSRSAPVAPIRRRNVPTASPFFDVTTPRPRRSRHDTGRPDLGEPRAPATGASSGRRRTRGGSGRRPGSASRGRGTGRAARPRGSARPRRPVERRRRRSPPPAAAAGCASRATDASRPIGSGPEPVDLGDPVARPRRVDGGQLVAEGGDEVALGAGHLRRSGLADRPVVRRRIPVSPSSARMIAAASRAGSWWCGVVRVDDVVEDEPRDRVDGRRPAQRDRSGRSPAVPAPRRARVRSAPIARRGCWPGRCRRGSGWRVATSASTCAGEVEAGRLAVLGRHVADVDARRRRRARPRRGWPGSAGSAGGSCTGCPGRGR